LRPALLCCITGLCFLAALGLQISCRTSGISAEEYYSIGMAYFEMGKYEEAELWLTRAEAADKTRTASEYNLGRIAFETGRYQEAARHFERVLERDRDNVMALRALAYSRIKTGEFDKAETVYARVLALVPDSLDDGYNHALVLFAMEKYEEAEKLITANPLIPDENRDMLLLLARTQRALGKVEAADSYAKWLLEGGDAQVRYEYAQTLEQAELYAKALEEYQGVLSNLPGGSPAEGLSRADVRFRLARVFLIADGENPQGITELKTALEEGFADREALESLEKDERISEANREEIRELIRNLEAAPE
jgi:tetratricopeptide (TPR) repeat protein